MYIYFSTLKCLLHILYITSCFQAQNTTLHSTLWARLNPLMVTNTTETTHHGLDRQMTIKTMHANHMPKWVNGELPNPRNKPAATAELQITRGVGVCSQGQGGTHTSLASQSNEWLAVLHLLRRIHSYFCYLGIRAQSHSNFMLSVKQQSLSLIKKIASFLFDPKLFSWG